MRRGWWEKELAAVPPVPEVVARPLILPLTMGSILAGVDPGRSHNQVGERFGCRLRRDRSVVVVNLLSSDSSIRRLSIRQSSSFVIPFCCRLIRQSIVCRFVNRRLLMRRLILVVLGDGVSMVHTAIRDGPIAYGWAFISVANI